MVLLRFIKDIPGTNPLTIGGSARSPAPGVLGGLASEHQTFD